MNKVLQMIDYEHLMDFEQYIRIEHMIEEDVEKADITWDRYVNLDDLSIYESISSIFDYRKEEKT